MEKETVLFICSFNSVRSRMAEGLLQVRCGNRYTVLSAGIAPAPLNPFAAAVMRELGIDINHRHPVSVTSLRDLQYDYIITLCDHVPKANLPLPQGKKTFHHGFISPCEIRENREEILSDFRKLRDRIDTYLSEIFPDCPPLDKMPGNGNPASRQVVPSQFRSMSRSACDRA